MLFISNQGEKLEWKVLYDIINVPEMNDTVNIHVLSKPELTP